MIEALQPLRIVSHGRRKKQASKPLKRAPNDKVFRLTKSGFLYDKLADAAKAARGCDLPNESPSISAATHGRP